MLEHFFPALASIRRILLSVLLIALLGCTKQDDRSVSFVPDVTKLRPLDSIVLPSHYQTMHPYFSDTVNTELQQPIYNEMKIKSFHYLLRRLKLASLREAGADSPAYRLIVASAWANDWFGSNLALTLAWCGDSAQVEAVELSYIGEGASRANPIRTEVSYGVKAEQLSNLSATLRHQGYWDAYSFDPNRAGWRASDGTNYYLEMRSDSAYKLLCFELRGNPVKDLLYPFLKATRYKRSVLQAIEQVEE